MSVQDLFSLNIFLYIRLNRCGGMRLDLVSVDGLSVMDVMLSNDNDNDNDSDDVEVKVKIIENRKRMQFIEQNRVTFAVN